jgi:hypothetical protein
MVQDAGEIKLDSRVIQLTECDARHGNTRSRWIANFVRNNSMRVPAIPALVCGVDSTNPVSIVQR